MQNLKAKLDRARERYEKQEGKVLDLAKKLKEAQKRLATDAEELSRAHVAYSRVAPHAR
jgi:chromosome segregation ATPase